MHLCGSCSRSDEAPEQSGDGGCSAGDEHPPPQLRPREPHSEGRVLCCCCNYLKKGAVRVVSLMVRLGLSFLPPPPTTVITSLLSLIRSGFARRDSPDSRRQSPSLTCLRRNALRRELIYFRRLPGRTGRQRDRRRDAAPRRAGVSWELSDEIERGFRKPPTGDPPPHPQPNTTPLPSPTPTTIAPMWQLRSGCVRLQTSAAVQRSASASSFGISGGVRIHCIQGRGDERRLCFH